MHTSLNDNHTNMTQSAYSIKPLSASETYHMKSSKPDLTILVSKVISIPLELHNLKLLQGTTWNA